MGTSRYFCSTLSSALLLLFCLHTACTDGDTGTPTPDLPKKAMLGETAPLVLLHDKEGRNATLAQYRGKTVLVDFWASWCGPCLREMPELRRIHEKFKHRDFVLLGISLDNTAQPWRRMVADSAITWPQLHDPEGYAAYAYSVNFIPRKYLIDRNGIVVDTAVARSNLDEIIEAELTR